MLRAAVRFTTRGAAVEKTGLENYTFRRKKRKQWPVAIENSKGNDRQRVGGLNKERVWWRVGKSSRLILKLLDGKATSPEEPACAKTLRQGVDRECGGAEGGRRRQWLYRGDALTGCVQRRCAMLAVLRALERLQVGR